MTSVVFNFMFRVFMKRVTTYNVVVYCVVVVVRIASAGNRLT